MGITTFPFFSAHLTLIHSIVGQNSLYLLCICTLQASDAQLALAVSVLDRCSPRLMNCRFLCRCNHPLPHVVSNEFAPFRPLPPTAPLHSLLGVALGGRFEAQASLVLVLQDAIDEDAAGQLRLELC
jgi:hypothetical protein